jgi:signal transduction histidine kinase
VARIAVWTVALAVAVAVAFVVPRTGALVTTYAGASPAAAALDLAAGLALLAAAVVGAAERSRLALPALLAGIVWFAPDWVGWEGGPPLARSLGLLLAPLAPAVLVHLVLGVTRGPRSLLPAAYAVTGGLALALALFRDPFEDRHCWSDCTDNVFLVHADRPLAGALGALWLGAAAALGLLAAAMALARLTLANAGALVPAAVAGLAGTTYAAALALDPAEDPRRVAFAAIFEVRAATFAGVGAGLAWLVTRGRRASAAVTRAAQAAGRPLRETLARALRDPGLEVAYPLPDGRRTVDARGRPITLAARVTTRIERGGQVVALVGHSVPPAGTAVIGAAARLAVDNERLQAVLLAQVADLRASRARIVETGDAARRGLERDLHDGAQQRLLALSYELRLAQAQASGPAAGTLAEAREEARAALDELRKVAHGIYPAVLAEAGLAGALESLADVAPVPVELGEVTGARHPAAVETAAYLVVAAGVEDAARRGASHAAVTVAHAGDRLRIAVRDDGRGPRADARHLADRVGALGGRLSAGTELEAEIPCA